MSATTVATVPAVVPSKFMLRSAVEAVLVARSHKFTEQSGFLKVIFPGGRLYIAATKTVRRVDISGFEVPATLGKVPHCGPFGAVKQQLQLGDTAETAMANLIAVLDIVEVIPAPAPKVKAPKAPKAAKGEKKGWGAVPAAPAAETDEAKLARIELIKRVAAEKGMLVSTNSVAAEAAE